MRHRFLGFAPKPRIGVLGGSFDPPHAGHVQISHEALRRFGLDEVWWLVTPQNPLKSREVSDTQSRITAAQAMVADTRIRVLDYESRAATQYTSDSLAHLTRTWRNTQFVWLMGADNLAQFHQWHAWHDIMHMVPIGILARPDHRMRALRSRAARIYGGARIPQEAAALLPRCAAPAWCFVNIAMSRLSSTQLRHERGRLDG